MAEQVTEQDHDAWPKVQDIARTFAYLAPRFWPGERGGRPGLTDRRKTAEPHGAAKRLAWTTWKGRRQSLGPDVADLALAHPHVKGGSAADLCLYHALPRAVVQRVARNSVSSGEQRPAEAGQAGALPDPMAARPERPDVARAAGLERVSPRSVRGPGVLTGGAAARRHRTGSRRQRGWPRWRGTVSAALAARPAGWPSCSLARSPGRPA
jgi:hypothetical protein